jgi:hypothetical protein
MQNLTGTFFQHPVQLHSELRKGFGWSPNTFSFQNVGGLNNLFHLISKVQSKKYCISEPGPQEPYRDTRLAQYSFNHITMVSTMKIEVFHIQSRDSITKRAQ